MHTRHMKVITAVAAVALATAACGSSASSSGGTGKTSASASSTAGSTPSGTPVNIGTIGSYSGPNASSESGAKKSIQAWVSWTNAHGGLAGHPVNLIQMDDAGNAATATTAMQKLINQDHVVAIVGEDSNLDVTWADIPTKAGVPVIGGLSLDLPFLTNPNFYPSGANQVAMIYGAMSIGKQSGNTFGDIYCSESPSCAAGSGLYAAVGAKLGMTVPLRQGVAASSTDFTSVCQAIKSSGVQAYTLSISGAVIVKLATQCKTQGVTATLVLTDGVVTPSLLTTPGTQNLLSAELSAPFFDDSVPATADYRAALKQYQPEIIGTAEDNPIAQYAWAGGQLLVAAVKASGSSEITSASIKAGLYKLPKGETLGGLTPPLNFAEGQPTHVNCTFTVGITDGKFTTPNGLKAATCAPDDLVNELAATFK